jgi:hypothetical protein
LPTVLPRPRGRLGRAPGVGDGTEPPYSFHTPSLRMVAPRTRAGRGLKLGAADQRPRAAGSRRTHSGRQRLPTQITLSPFPPYRPLRKGKGKGCGFAPVEDRATQGCDPSAELEPCQQQGGEPAAARPILLPLLEQAQKSDKSIPSISLKASSDASEPRASRPCFLPKSLGQVRVGWICEGRSHLNFIR